MNRRRKYRHLALFAFAIVPAITSGAHAQSPSPTSGKCLSDPWSLPQGQCSPMHTFEHTKITNVATTCQRPKGSDFRTAQVSWRVPKVVNDQKGRFDTLSVKVTASSAHPDESTLELLRNGKGVGMVVQLASERRVTRISQNPETKAILTFLQRAEVLTRLQKEFNRCVVGPTVIEAGGAACKKCRRLAVGMGIAYGAVGVACCAFTAGLACVGCGSLAVASGGFAVGAISESCDTTCGQEECKAAYDRCVGDGPASIFEQTPTPKTPKADLCKKDYDYCMMRAGM
jgi:hypothetical protein